MHRIKGFIAILLGGAIFTVVLLVMFPGLFKNQNDTIAPIPTATTGGIQTGDATVPSIQSGSMQTGAVTNTTSGQQVVDDDSVSTLHIAMPRRMYSNQFELFLSDLQALDDLQIKLSLADDQYSYQQRLDNEFLGNHEIDIALVPSERTKSYQKQALAMQISPSSRGVFHLSLYDLFSNPDSTYIPFAIDPLVTMVSKNRREPTQELTLAKLYNRLLTRDEQESPMPVLIGRGANDRKLLSKGRSAYPSQYITLSELLKNIIRSKNSQMLNQLIKIATAKVGGSRNYTAMRAWTNQQTEIEPQCGAHPIGCMLAYEYGKFAFATLSDIQRRESYIDGFVMSDFEVQPMIGASDQYPTRLWGRYINKQTQNRELIGRFVNEYIANTQRKKSMTPGLLISPFIVHQAQQQKNTSLKSIRAQESKRKPIVGSTKTQTERIEQLNWDILFDQNIDPSLWLYQQNLQLED